MEIVNHIVDFLMILIWLAPLIVAFGKLIAQKTNNQKLTNLIARANVIVLALEQTQDPAYRKKRVALEKLIIYAKEVGINLTVDQASDYIEHAVAVMNKLNKKEPVTHG